MINTIELFPGITLRCCRDTRFKQGCLSFQIVRPMCAESELLSYIDLIDSRMEIYRETLAEVPVGEFSGRIFALEKKIYHHP